MQLKSIPRWKHYLSYLFEFHVESASSPFNPLLHRGVGFPSGRLSRPGFPRSIQASPPLDLLFSEQNCSVLPEGLRPQRFGQSISRHFLGGKMLQCDHSFPLQRPNMMVSQGNVFGPWIEPCSFTNLQRAHVVLAKHGRFRLCLHTICF